MKSTLPTFKPMVILTCLIFLLSSCNKEDLFIEQTLLQEEEETTTQEEEIGENEFSVTLNDDFYETNENTAITINPSENDGEINSDIILSYSDPLNGVLSIENESILYTPNDNFTGEDFFIYKVCDGETGLICFEATVTISVLPVLEDEFSTELKAFPKAYGGGAYATGGRGGTVYHVTNLNDGGAGSLRWALDQPRPAIIVFDVSGVIECNNYLITSGQDLTIAGQTAPVGGITITFSNPNHTWRFWNVENMIIRYIRVRMQKDNNIQCIDVYGNTGRAKNLIFDHMSLSYSGWTAFGLRGYNSYNNTFQNSIIGESKTGAIFGDVDTGFIWNSYNNSFLGNYFYNTSHRFANPNSSNGTARDGSTSTARVDLINNVTQNHTFRLSRIYGEIKLNHMNNYYAAGANGALPFVQMNQLDSWWENVEVYTAGNIMDKGLFEDPNSDNKLMWAEFNGGSANSYAPISEFVGTMHPLIGAAYPIRTAEQAYQDIIDKRDVGANASLNSNGTVSNSEDRNDREYMDKLAEGEGAYERYTTGNTGNDRSFFFEDRYQSFLASITGNPVNTRSSDYDTDRDGMPDEWEGAKFGDLSRDGKGDYDNDGYTDLEEFLNLVDL